MLGGIGGQLVQGQAEREGCAGLEGHVVAVDGHLGGGSRASPELLANSGRVAARRPNGLCASNVCALASAPSRPLNAAANRSGDDVSKVCDARDCAVASVFLTRWLSSSIRIRCCRSARLASIAIAAVRLSTPIACSA